MREVFEQLIKSINEGSRVALVSEYRDSEIRRSLICEDDAEKYNALDRGDSISLADNGGILTLTEHYSIKPRLIILGGGHIALPLCRFGASLGFSVTVFDDRPSFANGARFPEASAVICDAFENVSVRLSVTRNDYVVVVTRGHRHDGLCLQSILSGQFPRYLGMIGSKRRVAIVKKQMQEETGETEKLDRLHAPIGLKIGAVTPEEIAISILAEIICDLRLGTTNGAETPEPWRFISPDMLLLRALAENRDERAALATVVSTEGSTPCEAGAKMLVLPHGQAVGSIGGGCAEAEVTQKAADIIQNGGFCVTEVDLTDSAEEDGMVCGGTMRVIIEAV